MPFELPDASGDPFSVNAAASLIGFISIRDKNAEITEPQSLGSGTLVRMPGEVYGVLTAAHVLDELPEQGLLGYLIFTRKDRLQQSKIKAELTRKYYAPGWRRGATVMPDLGFLQICDPDTLSEMRARGCSFYNLEKDRDLRIGFEGLAREYFATGVIAETRTVVEAGRGLPKRTGFVAIAGRCREAPARLNEIDQFTIFSVVIDTDRHPTSYEGMSGGGLWLLTAPDGDTDNMQRFFIGTIFFQSDATDDGLRILRVHGLPDIYDHLVSLFPK
ncbi:MAG: hypothetical protein EKK31_22235 [Hyphomicrobiales bacterium]|nr:MAG: hypothetical protein EKK31_22235 [Hyphomicrobiales bacterium]